MGTYSVYSPWFGCKLRRTEVEADDGLPIYMDALEGLAYKLKRRIEAGNQNVVLVVGDTNTGKSTIAIDLCKLIDPYFTLEGNYIYDTPDLAGKFERASYEPVCPVTLIDEASLLFNKQDHSTKEGKDALKLFDTVRLMHWTFILCAPSMDEINSKLLAVHVNYLIDCGAGAPTQGYSSKGFFKLFEKKKYLFSRTFWTQICWGVFAPLSAKEYAEYQKFKEKSSRKFRASYIKRHKEDDGDDGDNNRREPRRVQQDKEEGLQQALFREEGPGLQGRSGRAGPSQDRGLQG